MTLTIQVCDLVEESNRSLLSKHPSWERVKISDIATLLNGYAFKSSNFDKSKGFPLIRIRDIKTNITECCYNGDYDPAYVVKRGDLLIGMDGDFNVARWRGNDALLNQRVCKIQLSTNLFDGKLLEYLLPPYLDAIHEKTSSQTVKHLSSKSILEIPLPLPPLSEQHRIVAKIEELFTQLDAGVAALTTALAQLKRYRQSVLKAAFEGKLTEEWRERHPDEESAGSIYNALIDNKIKESKGKKRQHNQNIEQFIHLVPSKWIWTVSEMLFTTITSGSRGWARYYTNSGALFIRIGNLNRSSLDIDLHDIQKVSPPKTAETRRTRVKLNDILISITADIGNVALISEDIGEAYINQHICLARPINEIDKKYLAWYLKSESGGQIQFRMFQRGATKKGLGLDDIRSINIPLPPLTEQHEIVNEIERRFTIIDEMEKTIQQSLTQAERLRQSILKRAFDGKLVPQDPHDEPASLLLERIKKEKATLKAAVKGQKKTKRSEKNKTTQQELI